MTQNIPEALAHYQSKNSEHLQAEMFLYKVTECNSSTCLPVSIPNNWLKQSAKYKLSDQIKKDGMKGQTCSTWRRPRSRWG